MIIVSGYLAGGMSSQSTLSVNSSISALDNPLSTSTLPTNALPTDTLPTDAGSPYTDMTIGDVVKSDPKRSTTSSLAGELRNRSFSELNPFNFTISSIPLFLMHSHRRGSQFSSK